MSKAVRYGTTAPHRVRRRHFYIVLSLFAVCTLFYYFGELVNFAGWTALRWEFFYSVHDVHRIFFLAAMVYAGYFYRVRGALIVTLAAFVAFLPRALIISPYPDPMSRMVLFVIAAGMVSSLTGEMRNEYEKRSRLELLARTERDRLLKMLEGMEDGVIIIGPDKRIRFANAKMVSDFGEGVGSYCYKYLHDSDDRSEGICGLSSVLDGAAERWEYVFQDGRTFDVTASPFVDYDGEACQLATFRDITQRKQAELELTKLSKLKSELVSNVSHDLRSPLTSIKGAISSLLQKDVKLDDGTQQMLLSSVLEETDRLAGLVTKVLDMSKLEAGAWGPEKEHCHIADIINEAVERQKRIDNKHIFETYLEPDLPEIYADYIQIRQVSVNLLENAAAYSGEGTKITVTTRTVNGKIEVSVSDQGVGIPQEDLGKIFDKFYRGTQKRQMSGGAGLGLAICQTIVTNHGGEIWAESESGRGSTFHFTLPAVLPRSN
jgi:signal transduction histidine kinase